MCKKMIIRATRACLLAVLAVLATWSFASPGSDMARMMDYWYRFTARDCGNGRLASNCSGIILRGIDSKEFFRPWNPGPNSHNAAAGGNGIVSNGGVSVSYLRTDTKYDGLGLLKYNGLAFLPADFVDEKTQFKLLVLCAFAIDSWTGGRTNKGCGDYIEGGDTLGAVEDYCQNLGISNAQAWMKHYDLQTSDPDAYKAHKFQCGFDTANDYFGTFNKADAFNAFVESRKMLAADPEEKSDAEATQTELRIETWPDDDYWYRNWETSRTPFDAPHPDDTDPSKVAARTYKELPIAAFIYVGGIDFVDNNAKAFEGRRLAADDQCRWIKQTSTPPAKSSWKPVIKVQLPRNASEEAKFAYYPPDQYSTSLAAPDASYCTLPAAQAALAQPPVDAHSCEKKIYGARGEVIEEVSDYIEKVEWVENYQEPVLGTIASLTVTPTECGRRAGVGKVDEVYAELAIKGATHPQWNFDHLGSSMRRQLACHLDSPTIAVNKTTWSLEPARPYVAHDVIMKLDGNNRCNPNGKNT
jgi:hypothetical protein